MFPKGLPTDATGTLPVGVTEAIVVRVVECESNLTEFGLTCNA